MRRLRAFGYSVLVSLGVFVYLALPMLRSLFGPVVNLAIYAAVALLAGRVAWLLLVDHEDDPEFGPASEVDADEPDETLDVDENEVTSELETIKENR